eukprot:scaffold8182_cov110-Skeletonema_dohrnii-CCMP3373.AAC.6
MHVNERQRTPKHATQACTPDYSCTPGVNAERRACTPNAGRARRTPGVHARFMKNAGVHAILLAG